MRNGFWAGALAAGLLLTACGDDDAGDDASATTEASEDGGESASGEGDFCSAWSELLAGDPTPEQIREVAELAPEDAVEGLEALATGFEADPEGFFDTEEFATAFADIGSVANDECADEVLQVTAVDYGFEGIPTEIPAGTIGVEFANTGAEFHELTVMRRNDGVTQSFDEILALSEEEAGEFVTEIGGTFAPPGGSGPALLDLSEPGDYVAVCFIPVGATPENEDADGPPHFTQGMKTEFTVN